MVTFTLVLKKYAEILVAGKQNMTPDPQNYLALATIIANILIALIGIGGSWYMNKIQAKQQSERMKSQNARDDIDTARIALEISERATSEQLKLTQEVATLKKILQNQHYKVVVVFTLGESPRIESASVEALQNFNPIPMTVE